MRKTILLTIVGIVAGIVAGMIVMMALHAASTVIYPPPEGVDFMSQDPANLEKLNAWFDTLPTGAFLLATVCHGLGCMAGAAVATLISGRRSLLPAVVIGVFFTIGGIMNLSSVPHPAWFPFVDVPVYLVLALAAGLALKRSPAESAATAD